MENEKAEEEIVNQIYAYAADMLFEQKKSVADTMQSLIEQGLTAEQANTVVTQLQEQYKKEVNKAADKMMLYGALWFIGGVAVTAVTYAAATGGGTYVVTYGAILYGVIQFCVGLYRKFKA